MEGTKSNGILVIPSLNPTPQFFDLTKKMAEYFTELIVVNDGSTEETVHVFSDIKAELGDRVHILTHEVNYGKGVALKTAFTYYRDSGLMEKYVGVVTADSDGQHEFDDVKMIDEKLGAHHDRAMIIGHRDIDSPIMPPKSKVGNKITAFLFNALYGVKLKDTQTGLRAFSNDIMDWLIGIKGDKFEYEMRMLILSKDADVAIYEYPITTKYEEVHVSHYKPFRDSIRVGVVLMGSFFSFLLAALVSFGVDIGLFALFDYVVFSHLDLATALLWATVVSRVSSSILNFVVNRLFTFGGKRISRKSILKYYALWITQLLVSYLCVLGFTQWFGADAKVLIKCIVDISLALCSYQIQMRWVFKKKREKKKK